LKLAAPFRKLCLSKDRQGSIGPSSNFAAEGSFRESRG
jgi:hypothetical protein